MCKKKKIMEVLWKSKKNKIKIKEKKKKEKPKDNKNIIKSLMNKLIMACLYNGMQYSSEKWLEHSYTHNRDDSLSSADWTKIKKFKKNAYSVHQSFCNLNIGYTIGTQMYNVKL